MFGTLFCIVPKKVYLCYVNQKQLKIIVMKKSTQGFINQLSKQEICELTTVVKETIALEMEEKQEKIFTVADLWNIHRTTKPRSQRRYI